MKTCYTVPELSSLDNNGIKDLMSINCSLEQLRVLHLDGSFFRIEITKDYIELNSIEEIDLTNYLKAFEKIQEFIHQNSKVYLFGVSDNNKISIYDIYLNENFLSTKDLKIFESFGIPITEPIIFGNITLGQVLEEYKKYNKLFILPMVYINDTRSESQRITTKIISGKKEERFITPNYPIINSVFDKEEFKIEKVELKPEKPEVFNKTTKEERTQIFNETYKNVSFYIETIKNTKMDQFNTLTNEQIVEWWEKNGKEVTYLYSIYTLPKTRGLVYEYFDYTYVTDFDDEMVMVDTFEISNIFFELWHSYHPEELRKHNLDFYDDIVSQECFQILFENELEVFVGFFNKEYVEPTTTTKGQKIV